MQNAPFFRFWHCFFILLAACQVGCTQNQAVEVDSTAEKTVGAKTEAAPPNKNRYFVSSARQKSEIDTLFPFDITLRRMDSSQVSTAELLKPNGKPTVLAFWLTTCYPCRVELSDYAKKFETWQKDTPFNLYAVSIDFPDRFGNVKKYVAAQNWPFGAVWDYSREFKEVLPGGLNGLPQVFLFDATGKLVYQHKKYHTGDDDLLFEAVKIAAKK